MGFTTPFIRTKIFDIIFNSNIGLGTFQTYISQGAKLRFGIFNTIDKSISYHTNLTNEDTPLKNEFFIDVDVAPTYWIYKSTVEGRFFGSNENLKIKALRRINWDLSTALNFTNRFVTIFYRAHLVTAETKATRHYYYGSIGLIFNF